jgi:hypothetical protein
MKHRQVRAEKAYAELKKSGFKGIGAPNAVDSDVADETWNAIQDQMDYKMTADDCATREQNAAAPTPTTTPTPARHETGLSKLKSLSELRKRTSTLNLPSVRHRDVSPIPPPSDRESEDSHRPVQRRQSRKDLSRQAKLLKKVSNLEDKLGRARRELRELANNEEDSTLPSICVDGAHARKFVPGTLPSLPSERLLHDQAEDESGGKSHDHSEPEHRMLSSVSPKRPRKLSKTRPSAEDSLSPRKRKSSAELPSNKGSRSDDGGDENHYHHQHPDIDPSNTPRKASSRQSKSQKTARADSPGGAKSLEPDHTTNGVGNSPRKVKPTRDKRSSSLTTKSSQRLKAKQSSRNLRQVATDDEADGKRNGKRNGNKGPFYLQEQHQIDSNILKIPPAPSSPNTKKTTEWEEQDEENIPPVPPVPKELLLEKNTTKMMIGGAKASGGRRLEKIDEAKSAGKHQVGGGGRIPSTGFTWPEDIF